MPKSKSFEKKGPTPFGDSSEDEEIFSAEDTENESSSDEEKENKKKKRQRNSDQESDSDPDDPKPKRNKGKRELSKKKITLLSEEAIKNKFRYKKHTCALSDLPTKTKVCIK